jgi:hypothetical protein
MKFTFCAQVFRNRSAATTTTTITQRNVLFCAALLIPFHISLLHWLACVFFRLKILIYVTLTYKTFIAAKQRAGKITKKMCHTLTHDDGALASRRA